MMCSLTSQNIYPTIPYVHPSALASLASVHVFLCNANWDLTANVPLKIAIYDMPSHKPEHIAHNPLI